MESRKKIHISCKGFVKSLSAAFLLTVIIFAGYLYFEPAIVSAISDDLNVTQAVTSEITITSPANVTMSGAITGMTGGSTTGSATWTIRTNDTSGFNMTINSDTSNCLRNGPDHFNDYIEAASGTPDFNWASPAVSAFGYTVEPATASDTVQAFKDDGSVCGGAGTLNTTDRCWKGFSTVPSTVVNRPNETSLDGEDEVIKFRAQLASGQYLPEGNYIATITVTAVTN